MTIILAIESSCDETATAILDDSGKIYAELVLSQIEKHRIFGGVVPEIAARSHLEVIDRLIIETMQKAELSWQDIDIIASTGGPGLIGGLVIGVTFAKSLAYSLGKPYMAINHLEGHILVPRLSTDLPFPYLILLVSGGHSQIILVEEVGSYHIIGTTIDDALGEAFDKLSKMLGEGYPGGPIVEKLALNGNPERFLLPKPLLQQQNCNFSFSGLKTALKQEVNKIAELTPEVKADLCASFQFTIAQILKDRLSRAIEQAKVKQPTLKHLVIAGGVGANQYLRTELTNIASENGLSFVAPPAKLCTDNAVMIGWAACERVKLKSPFTSYEYEPQTYWPLSECNL